MSAKSLIALFALMISLPSLSNDDLIAEYGEFKKVTNPDFKINFEHKYKVVFDVYTTHDDPAKVNRGINTVARFINMHLDAGVKLENLDIALVIHGKAGKDILLNKTYYEKFNADNPNLPLIKQLLGMNVNVIVCGQTLGFNNYARESVIPKVKVSLSAMTALVDLQNHGYAQINFN